MIECTTTVRVIEGLHTRPAAQIARAAKGFGCHLELVCRGTAANAKSSVKLMLLGVKEGEEVTLRADGSDESSALVELLAHLQDPRFGLGDDRPAGGPATAPPALAEAVPAAAGPAAPAAPAGASTETGATGGVALRGVVGSRGCAIGPVHAYAPRPLVATRQVIAAADVAAELDRFRAALAAFVAQLDRTAEALASQQDRAILQATAEVAQDEEYVGAIVRGIEGQGDAAAVTLRVGRVLAESFAALADPYMRARAEDIRGVTRQLAAALLGCEPPDLAAMREPSIVLAHDLSAWEFAQLPIGRTLGLVCSGGAATSHVAIMARTYGLPAVLGVPLGDDDFGRIRTIAVDGNDGTVILDPDGAQAARVLQAIDRERSDREALQRWRDVQPRTRDGRVVEVAANLGSLDEIGLAQDAGAAGVGLFRTELLFMQRASLPSEDDQAAAYERLARAFAPQPVVIRTLDIGGDKPVAGIDFPREENPFLGWRGVRMCLDRPDVFKPQLRALLRAAVAGNLRVMVPMVSCVDEVRQVKALIDICERELREAGTPCARFELGIMVETPAAVLQADALAAEVAFFSIGTNDLTQYVMATDRANAKLASLYRTEHPAVMRAVELACQAAQRAGIWIGVCGEAAANPALLPRFVAMGVSELSMSPAAILAAKQLICTL